MARTGFDTKLHHVAGTTETEITGLQNLTIPPAEVNAVDVTHLQSLAKEFIPGMIDSGELAGECLYTETLYTDFNAWKLSMQSWKVTFPDTVEVTFQGFVTKSEMEAKYEDPLMIKFTIKVSGAITITGS